MSSRTILAAKSLALALLVLAPFLVKWGLDLGSRPLFERSTAAQLISSGDYARAYRRLLREDAASLTVPQRARLEFQLAVCERLLHHPARALARLARLARSIPAIEDYRLFWIARCLEDMERSDEAISAYRDLLAQGTHAELLDLARLRLSALYASAGKYPTALKLCTRLRNSTTIPQAEVLYRIGRIHGLRNDPRQQRLAWLELAREFPRDPRALQAMKDLPPRTDPDELQVRGQVQYQNDQFASAAQLWRQFVRRYPRHPQLDEIRLRLGKAYARLGDYDRARRVYQRIFAISRRPAALYRLAGIQVRQGQDSTAIQTYIRFLRLFPHHDLADDALWQAAKAAERRDDFAAAQRLYQRLAEDYPQGKLRDEAGWNIGFMFYCRQEYSKALVVFERLAHMAREPHIVDQSLFWAGKVAEQLGLDAQAKSYYRRAAAGFPRSYYSSRAVALGYGLLPRLARPSSPASRTLPSEPAPATAAGQCLLRADALAGIGLRDLARRELEHAEALSRNDQQILRVVRNRYELFGLLADALRLSMRLFSTAGEQELQRIYPAYYWTQIADAAKESGVDPYLVLSIIRQESSFNAEARSRVGALGLMQLMPQTGGALARSLGLNAFERDQLLDPGVSIRLGSRFLGEQVRGFSADAGKAMQVRLGLAAYNAGSRNARRWLERLRGADPDAFVERIPYQETRKYVKLVLKNYTIYKALSNV